MESSLTLSISSELNSSSSSSTQHTSHHCYEPPSLDTIQSPYMKLFLFILYSGTSILSLIGNLIVIIVQVYGRESAKTIRRHLIVLAIADVITGVFSVPFTYTIILLNQWIFPHWLCPTAQYVQLLSVFVTAATLSIIGIERYVWPFGVRESLTEGLEKGKLEKILCTNPNCNSAFSKVSLHDLRDGTTLRHFCTALNQNKAYFCCCYI